MGDFLSIQEVGKTFVFNEGHTRVLEHVNLEMAKGEFISIIGPSGCGKSTLLKIVAGLDTDIEGRVLLEGQLVDRPSKTRGFIFQEHRLFPWLTVEENIAADLSLADAQVKQKVNELIRLVKLEGFQRSYPKELSGGMSQRVAIARSLLRNPKVLLLDEPFGALDAFTRTHMQDALLDIWRHNETTMLFVTHDIDEAVFLATRIVVLEPRPGRIKGVLHVDLPYPRDRLSPSFQELRQLVLRTLNNDYKEEECWSI
ncbi:Aliphatic sulfonates import ATP-binding protein SsuB [compost metagenome]